MKMHSPSQKRQGFTLVELLVVITIIAVLAGLGAVGGRSVMEKAKRTAAQATATNVSSAVQRFYSDYSVLPDPTNSADDDAEFSTTAENGKALIEILAGLEDEQNDRKLNYLSIKDAKGGRDGIEYNSEGTSVEGLYDPWGEAFYVYMDYDYDERLEFIPNGGSAASIPEVKLNGRISAVYSLGTDSPDDAKQKTLATSW